MRQDSWRRPRVVEMVRTYPWTTVYLAVAGYLLALVEAMTR